MKSRYNYDLCTPYIKMKVQALAPGTDLCKRYLGGPADSPDYKMVEADLRHEIEKFGPIIKFQLPRENEPNAGYAYVEFINVTSAFSCYNILNGRKFMGQ